MTAAWLSAAVLVAFPVVFVAFWSAVCWLISRFGWATLAARWATELPPPRSSLGMCTGRVGLANYKGTLELAADREALWMDVMVLFRPGHRPLRIPWAEVEALEGGGWRLFRAQRLRAGGVEIQLREGDWAALQRAAGRGGDAP